MTPQDLIAAFETFAEAPEGVTRLRELVLQLAVRGKLVPQDPEDMSATDLRARAVAESAVAPKSRVKVNFESSPPFEAPSNWAWLYLREAMNLVNGKAFKPSDWTSDGLPIVRIQNLNREDAPFNRCNFEVKSKYYIDDGDLLLSWSGTPGTSFGAFIWSRGCAVLNQHIFRCEPRADAFQTEFLRLAVNSRLDEMIERAHGAVGLRHVTRGQLDGLWLPVPPQDEQYRIVARVDELMGLLDRLEAARDAREATRVALRDAALAELRDADDAETVEVAWARVAEHMDDLFTHPDDVAPLRQTILQLAVRGRLVPQDPTDEPASVLLERIAAEPTWRLPERPRRGKLDPAIEALAGRRQIPAGWLEVRLEGVAQLINGRAYKKRELLGSGTPVIRIQNLNGGQHWYYSDLELPPRQYCDRGDLLFAWSASFGPYIWTSDRAIYHYHIWKLNLSGALDRDYMFWVLMHLTDEVRANSHGLAMLHMTKGKMERWPLPLPPLAEQRRIVARVDELMGLCDTLEERLRAAVEAQAGFAAAAVHHLDA